MNQLHNPSLNEFQIVLVRRRLLGQDDNLQARCNSGFQEPDEGRWAQWSAADRDAITELDA